MTNLLWSLIPGLFIAFIVIYEVTRKWRFDNKLKTAIKECKIGKTIPYESLKQKWEQEDIYDKAHPIQTWFKYRYYSLRRFFFEIPELPRYGYRKIKRGIQRAYRGWADEDTWNSGHYLSKVILEMLIRHKKYSTGYPNNVLPVPTKVIFGSDSSEENEYYKNCELEWKNILETMIYAFKLNVDLENGDRENYWPKLAKKKQLEFKCLTKEEEKCRQEGMKLFCKYLHNLWD